MSSEPERPIEQSLRAFARHRRADAGAPVELHPPTRRVLQGEAARQFGQSQRQPRSVRERLLRVWPRFAVGFGVVAVMAVLASRWLPGPGRGKPTFASRA